LFMNHTTLKHELLAAFGDVVPGELIVAQGKRLRRQYEDCVERYRKIVQIAGNRPGHEGSRQSEPINLGEETLPAIGRVSLSAVVRFCPFQNAGSGTSGRSNARPFNVEIAFSGRDGEGRVRPGPVEHFGSVAYNFFGFRAPAWIRNPGTTLEEPWGDEASLYDYRGGREYPWDKKSYRVVASRLSPMIASAVDTQALLVAALQDPALNPQFAEQARVDLMAPGRPLAA
jgi:hypothetical protein